MQQHEKHLGEVHEYQIKPEDFGIKPAPISALQVAAPLLTVNTFTAVSDVNINFVSGFTLFKLTVWDMSVAVDTTLSLRCLTSGVPDAGATDYARNQLVIGNSVLPSNGNAVYNAVPLSPTIYSTFSGNRLEALITTGTAATPFTINSDFYGLVNVSINTMQKTNARRAVNGAKSGVQLFVSATTFSGQYILQPIA